MIGPLGQLSQAVWSRLSSLVISYVPGALAALVVLLAAFLAAVLARWVLTRAFKGIGVDRFLRQSGIAAVLTRSGRLRVTPLAAAAAYWAILVAGLLMALSVFDSKLTSRVIDGVVLVFPKLVIAALILVAGLWLGQYLSRSVLVWAFNENLPWPRRLAAAARLLVMLAAVATAADQLDFGRNVFLAAFILLVGGAALAAGLALGLGGGAALRRYLQERAAPSQEHPERSLWTHL